VDRRVYREQTGLPTDSTTGEEGVNYLRHLKGSVPESTPADAAKGDGKAPATATSVVWKERRKCPRFRCSGTVEFRAESSDDRMWGTLTDISLYGCYVEMPATFPIDTKVNLVLKSLGTRIQVPGTVRASYPFLGMGICFAEIEPEQRKQLKQLLDALSGRNAVSKSAPAQDDGTNNALASADPRAFLDEIAAFFQKNHLLSRDELHQIAKRVRRS
jgi:hypothetical protein